MQVAGRRRRCRVGSPAVVVERRARCPVRIVRSSALSGLSQVVIVLRHVKCESPVTGRRNARMIAPMGAGSIPPRDTVPGPSPTRRSTRSSPSSTRSGWAARSRARDLVARTGLSRGDRRAAGRRAARPRPDHRGRPGAEHRRSPAAPADVPRRRRARPGRGPRRDQHRRRGHDARRPDPRPPRRAGRHRGRARGRARPGRRAVRRAARDDPRRLPGRLWGVGIGVPGPGRVPAPGGPISPSIMPGWDGYPVRERFAARYGAPVWVDNDVNVLALGRVAVGRRGGPRQRDRRQDRDRHRGRDHLATGGSTGARRAPPATSATSRSSDDRDRRLPLRQHRLPRGARRAARRSRATARRPRATGGAARLRERARPRGRGDRRGRRAGRVVRRPGRASSCSRPAGRRVGLDARERRQLLQPVAGRDRRRRGPERRRRSWRRSARSSTARSLPLATRDLLDPAVVAGRRSRASSGRRRWSWTSCSRASRWRAGSRPASRRGCPRSVAGGGGLRPTSGRRRRLGWEIAQLNVGRAVAPLDERGRWPGFMARLDEINALAERSPGFVWRLQGDSGNNTDLTVAAATRCSSST